jgi:hypothetical protein
VLVVILLLAAVLRWSEPEATGGDTIETSINKVFISCRFLNGGQYQKFLSSHCSDAEEGFNVLGCGLAPGVHQRR